MKLLSRMGRCFLLVLLVSAGTLTTQISNAQSCGGINIAGCSNSFEGDVRDCGNRRSRCVSNNRNGFIVLQRRCNTQFVNDFSRRRLCNDSALTAAEDVRDECFDAETRCILEAKAIQTTCAFLCGGIRFRFNF